MGAFSYHRFIFLLACIDRWKVYNRLVFTCTVKTAIEVQCLCVSTSKNGTFLGLLHFSLSLLFAGATINQANLAFRMNIIEDTHLTLAVIPFKVEANNSFNFFAITNTREKICRVSVPVQSIIPWVK